MSEEHSLLAHLVQKLTPQVEDAATDALAFILNRSERCRNALREMVSQDEHQLVPLERASTQVATSDGGRLDLVAYDADESKRLIIESKFWAALLSGQASGYVQQLAPDGRPATLLFVAPEVRRETLWAKIEGQFSQEATPRLGEARQEGRVKVADVDGTDIELTGIDEARQDGQGKIADVTDCKPDPKWRVALTSWYALLNRLEAADSSMVANIRQLRSLAAAALRCCEGEMLDAAVRLPSAEQRSAERARLRQAAADHPPPPLPDGLHPGVLLSSAVLTAACSDGLSARQVSILQVIGMWCEGSPSRWSNRGVQGIAHALSLSGISSVWRPFAALEATGWVETRQPPTRGLIQRRKEIRPGPRWRSALGSAADADSG